MQNKKYSRELQLEKTLVAMGYPKALKALAFVADAMSISKGFKRHDGTAYYLHLVDVTQDLINHGIRDENIITAALLHDAIEDIAGASKLYITSEYGQEVADMVSLVTKDKSINYHDNPQEMRDYLDAIKQHPGAALVKTADRVHNFSSMRAATSDNHKRRQVANTEEFFIPFFKECRNAYPQYATYFYAAKYFIEPTMFAIKEYLAVVDKLEACEAKTV